jgi:Asp-tRNA(Asn)/Glu-tRNA(Gln) amidotransferase A subunit family amidase
LSVGDYLATLEKRSVEIEPKLLALMEEPGRFTRAREAATLLEARFPTPVERPPLYGVPVGVKDIFRVDTLPTTAGSRLPPAEFEGSEARAVSQLKRAGALVLAKTVSTEFAYFGPGPTRNPHDPGRTPGGSSSGSAAAVAAGLVPLALGTQTIGSISRPAAYCGVVGYKPSYDRISREGVIPLSPSLDHVGIFTTDVAGAELAASALCAGWSPKLASGNPVLGIPKGPILKRASSESLHHLKAISDRLKERGFEVRVVPAMEDFEEIESRHRTIVAAEAAAVHSSWYADWGALYHPKTVSLLAAGRDVSEPELAAALAGRQQLRDQLTALMAECGVDLWISPAAPGVAPEGLDSTGDPVMNLPWSHCGLPTLAIPSGANSGGLPLGLQVAGGWMKDELLFGWGKRIEAALV